MAGAEGRFAGPLRPLEQRLGSGVIPKRHQQPGEALQRTGDQQVIGTEVPPLE